MSDLDAARLNIGRVANGYEILDLDLYLEVISEVESLRAKLAAVEALVKPIYDRTEGQIGTHSDRCHEYHSGCLAVAVKLTIGACERSIETTERGGTNDRT